MEEKELNLAELLKGCEEEKFFSISVGKVIFKAIYDYDDTHKIRTIRKDVVGNEYNVNFHSDGRRNKAGLQDLYPSEDLLRKYPLDAYSAWMEWKEARKSKRWRAKNSAGVAVSECEGHWEDYTYWYITSDGVIAQDEETNCKADTLRYELGNYFRTEEEVKQAAEAVREALQKFYEKNCEE
ncbi:MAG: hypothetical protein K2M69_05815 [Muribaculaceae bacterium]|nr:hypothetical protein [Muribaculaceae bacterium]